MSETKQALNIYGVLDNELARLHRMVETFAIHNERYSNRYPDRFGGLGGPGFGSSSSGPLNVNAIYDRIIEIQNIMLTAVASSDAKIQEAVAELALIGKPSFPPDEIPF